MGLNNSDFHGVIERTLGVTPNGNTGRVEGHAVMENLSNPDVLDPDIGEGFPTDSGPESLVDSLTGITNTPADDVHFPITPLGPLDVVETILPPIEGTPVDTLEWHRTDPLAEYTNDNRAEAQDLDARTLGRI